MDAVRAAAALAGASEVTAFVEVLSVLRGPAISDARAGETTRPPIKALLKPRKEEASQDRVVNLIVSDSTGTRPKQISRAPGDPIGDFLTRVKAIRGDDSKWLPPGKARRPVHFPLISSRTFRAVLGALGRHRGATTAIDLRRLVDSVARRKPLKILPRRQRLGLGSNVIVVRDLGPGMIPFQPDMDDFVSRVVRHIGGDRVRRWEITEEGRLRGPTIEPGSTIVILSDLHGFAQRYGYDHTRYLEWIGLLAQMRATGSHALVLAPGTFPRQEEAVGQVPLPAFGDLFGGRRPRIGPVLPWDEALTARRAAAFAQGQLHAASRTEALDPRDPSWPRLLRLLALVHDVDQHTLRLLRLVLRDPAAILRGYRDEIDPGDELKRWRADTDLEPCDTSIGAFHEHAVWTSAYIAARGRPGHLSGKIEEHRLASAAMSAGWRKIVEFAREAIVRGRAGRGFLEIVADSYQWARATQDFEEIQPVLAAIEHRDGSNRRLARIDRSLRGNSVVHPEGEGTPPSLTLRLVGDVLHTGLDEEKADIRLPLPEGFDLKEGSVEVWRRLGATAPTLTRSLWPLRQQIPMDHENGTIVVRLGSQIALVNLRAARTAMLPLFSRHFRQASPEPQTLRFHGEEIHFRGRRYDKIGLKDLGPATPRLVRIAEAPEGQSIGCGPNGLWLRDTRTLIAQRSVASSGISAINLPVPDERTRQFTGAGQDGHALVVGAASAWLIVADGEAATVVRWNKSHPIGRPLTAASRAGGVLAHRNPKSPTSFHFFPPPASEMAREVITAQGAVDPDEMAMSDAGYIAVRDGSMLHLFEPISSLGSGKESISSAMKAAAGGDSLANFSAQVQDTYSRKWLPAAGYEVAEALHALASDDADNLARLSYALNESSARPEAAEIAAACQIEFAPAGLIASIFARDLLAMKTAEVEHKGASFVLPGSGLSPLHLACLLKEPGDLVPSLLRLGFKPNSRDRFGRTCLYLAAFCRDAGLTLGRLLDAGADPALVGNVEGTVVGPLAASLFDEGTGVAPPPELITRLIAGGADARAYDNRIERRSALQHAATRVDVATFRAALAVDDRVNYQSNDGTTPLIMAAGAGRLENLRILIEHGADPGLVCKDGFTALSYAVAAGHADCVTLLLRSGARVDRSSDAAEVDPLSLLLNPAMRGELAVDRVERVAEVLAAGGVQPDRAPWPFVCLFSNAAEPANAALRGFRTALGKAVGVVETVHYHATKAGQLTGQEIRSLLSRQIDFDARGPAGLRLTHLIAMYCADASFDAFRVLLSRGVDLEAADDHGSTVLHYACAAGNANTARSLLRVAPSLAAVRRSDGRTAADVAWIYGHAAVAQELGSDRAPTVPDAPGAIREHVLAQLTLLPHDAPWQVLPLTIPFRARGGAPTAPLPATVSTWKAVMARKAPLPYPVVRELREIWWRRDDGVMGVSAEVLGEADEVVMTVNGTSPPIHEMNNAHAPTLDSPSQMLTYLKFFCHSVHGEDGPFAICDTREGLARHLGPNRPTTELPSSIPRVWLDDAGEWHAEATVRYGDNIFDCRFKLRRPGLIEMIDDNPVPGLSGAGRFDTDGTILYLN